MKSDCLRVIVTLISLFDLGACSSKGVDPAGKYGADLSEPSQYLLPPMSFPKAIGWRDGDSPAVSPRLKVEAFATSLEHAHTVYTLRDGDVLVVESNSPGTGPFRPKDFIAGRVKARAGTGEAKLRTVFIDQLHSPYGMVLVGETLYVANTEAILALRYMPGETQTKSMTAGADDSDLYVGMGSNSNITDNGIADDEDDAGAGRRDCIASPR
jgi:glucose/arabinose dehydrogenase